jgi:hypothetical protein
MMADRGGYYGLVVSAEDYLRLGRVFRRLPEDLQKIAFGRAAARAKSVVERDYSRYAAQVLKVPQRVIKSKTRSFISSGDITLVVRSKQIRLDELGASQRNYGVYVRGRGRIEKAFIAKAMSKRAAGLVMKRDGKKRTPVTALFGPNPAGAIDRKPADYEQLLQQIAEGEFAKTILQQAVYLMSRAG